jgi:amino acid permease
MGDDDDDAPSLQEPLLLVPESSTTPAKAAAQPDTFWPCVMNLAKVITGAGMMAIPRALWLIGWAPATLIMVGVAALTCFTLAVLVQGSASTQAGTYAELVYRTCGRSLARLLQLAVLLFCFGFSVVYLVSLGQGWP